MCAAGVAEAAGCLQGVVTAQQGAATPPDAGQSERCKAYCPAPSICADTGMASSMSTVSNQLSVLAVCLVCACTCSYRKMWPVVMMITNLQSQSLVTTHCQ